MYVAQPSLLGNTAMCLALEVHRLYALLNLFVFKCIEVYKAYKHLQLSSTFLQA